MGAGGYGLAALSGLLGGLQGLPQGMTKAMEFAQREQALDEQKRQFDEGRFTDLSTLAPLLKAGGMDVSALPAGKVPNTILPTLLQLQQKRADTADKAGAAQDIQRQLLESGTTTGMAPGASLSMPQPGDLMAPPPQQPMGPLTEQRVEPRMATLAKLVPGLLRADPAAATGLLKDTFAPPKPMLVGDTTRGIYTPGGGYTPLPGAPETDIPPGMVPSSVTRHGVTYKPPGEDKPEKTLPERVAAARERVRLNPGDPQARQDLSRLESAWKLELEGRQAGATVLKPPDSDIIKTTAQQNEVIGLGTDLLSRLKANPNVKPGVMARLGETELPGGIRPSDVIGQQQTDEQRKFMADVTALIGTYRNLKAGLNVTKSEAEYSLPIIPMNPGAVTPQQIQALVDWGKRNKAEMDRALTAARKLPSAPAPAAPAAPSPTQQGEALSRRDPRYQQARQRGMTDQQIQSKYGITLTD